MSKTTNFLYRSSTSVGRMDGVSVQSYHTVAWRGKRHESSFDSAVAMTLATLTTRVPVGNGTGSGKEASFIPFWGNNLAELTVFISPRAQWISSSSSLQKSECVIMLFWL